MKADSVALHIWYALLGIALALAFGPLVFAGFAAFAFLIMLVVA